jgi:hypothetical protein
MDRAATDTVATKAKAAAAAEKKFCFAGYHFQNLKISVASKGNSEDFCCAQDTQRSLICSYINQLLAYRSATERSESCG